MRFPGLPGASLHIAQALPGLRSAHHFVCLGDFLVEVGEVECLREQAASKPGSTRGLSACLGYPLQDRGTGHVAVLRRQSTAQHCRQAFVPLTPAGGRKQPAKCSVSALQDRSQEHGQLCRKLLSCTAKA